MDMNLLGETVAIREGNTYRGFWMQAGGNNGVAAAEVFFSTPANGFKVILETKSSDEPDSAATQIGNVTVTAAVSTATSYQMLVADAKDLVRYALEALDDGVIHLQYAQPLWQPN